jgi:hypothetical protein
MERGAVEGSVYDARMQARIERLLLETGENLVLAERQHDGIPLICE